MQNEAGDALLAGAEGLAAFLATQPHLQLFFVNGCCTHAQIAGLHAAGVPIVIATREEVDDAAARQFAVHFHRGLSSGSSVAGSFAAAKGAMQAATYENARHWDGDLWVLSAAGEADRSGAWATAGCEAPWRVPFLRNDSFVGHEKILRTCTPRSLAPAPSAFGRQD